MFPYFFICNYEISWVESYTVKANYKPLISTRRPAVFRKSVWPLAGEYTTGFV